MPSAFELMGWIGGFATALGFLWRIYKIEKGAEASNARVTELERKNKKDAEDYKDSQNAVRNYYDEKIERHEQEIKRLHDGIDAVILKSEQHQKSSEGWAHKAAEDIKKWVDGLDKK